MEENGEEREHLRWGPGLPTTIQGVVGREEAMEARGQTEVGSPLLCCLRQPCSLMDDPVLPSILQRFPNWSTTMTQPEKLCFCPLKAWGSDTIT